jgi:hypothetical protein
VAGAAGLGLFHFGHGKMLAISQIKDGIVTYSAIIVVFGQMGCMAENNRVGVFKGKLDILCLYRFSTGCRKQ